MDLTTYEQWDALVHHKYLSFIWDSVSNQNSACCTTECNQNDVLCKRLKSGWLYYKKQIVQYLNDKAKSGRPKTLDSEILFQAKR